LNKFLTLIILFTIAVGIFGLNYSLLAFANPFFENGQFTPNGIEWCQENFQLYEILGEKFFEHHKHSIESRVCAALYEDPLWNEEREGKVQKLIEKSRHFALLEISESIEESQTGVIDTTPVANRDKIILQGMTEDGQVTVQLSTTKPIVNTMMQIEISFLDSDKTLIPNVSYSIEAIQENTKVISSNGGLSDNGLATISTIPLSSDAHVKINLTINELGLSEDAEYWESSKGQVIMFNVVPEFGTITMVILAVAIISIVAVTSKSRVVPRF